MEKSISGRHPNADGLEFALMFREGDVIADRYLVKQVLGEGGMGVVVEVVHTDLDERRAIKFVHAHAAENPTLVERFMREARAASKIRSEFALKVFDVARLPNGIPYMVLEFLEGEDMEAYLRREGTLPIQTAVDYTLQLLEALNEAHRLGIVHRDLKPANLFRTTDSRGRPCIKVLDFGISRSSSEEVGLTNTGQLLGTPLFMSPEQWWTARDIDGRADIWSVGAVLFQFLSGAPPFRGTTMPEVCAAVLEKAPPSLMSLRPEVPAELQHIVERCLAKDREQRPATAAEVAIALAPYASPRQQLASIDLGEPSMSDFAPPPTSIEQKSRPVSSTPVGSTTASIVTQPRTDLHLEPSKAIPAILIAGFVTLVISGVVIATTMWSGTTADRGQSTASAKSAAATAETESTSTGADSGGSQPATNMPSTSSAASSSSSPTPSSTSATRSPIPPAPPPTAATRRTSTTLSTQATSSNPFKGGWTRPSTGPKGSPNP